MDAIRVPLPVWARLSSDKRSIALTLHVQPGARVSTISGLHGDALKVRIAAPATENRANAALIGLLSDALGIAPSKVRIAQGDKSRRKVVQIDGDLAQMTIRLCAWDKQST
jgi:uncharacterized protein (TIGR00251 family)